MEAKPFWTIYQAATGIEGLENAAILKSVGSSRTKLETALDEMAQADAVLVEFTDIGGRLTDPRIVGHLTEGKDALMVSIFPAAPPSDWQSHLVPAG